MLTILACILGMCLVISFVHVYSDLNKEDFFQTSNAEKDKFEEEYGEMKTYRVRYPGADNLNQKVKMVQ